MDTWPTDEMIGESLRETLERLWGTGWGEAELAAYEAIVQLAVHPESTQPHRRPNLTEENET
jgi:hypothetical protein